jgi:mannose-1-phosphate guanylyltransferase
MTVDGQTCITASPERPAAPAPPSATEPTETSVLELPSISPIPSLDPESDTLALENMNNVYAVIMAGGAGTRFWPLSRKLRPKQLLPLGGQANIPLITATAQRIAPIAPPSRTVVVTGKALEQPTRSALPDLPAENILLEPVGRNTAPCVGWATAWVARRDPQAVIAVLAADAFIRDDRAFVDALEIAARAASNGSIVTLGIKPTRAETGYGYLHVGAETSVPGVYRVQAFVEKPDASRAEQYLRGGEHLWNAGIFVYRADVMQRAIEQHLPAVSEAMRAFDSAAERGNEQAIVDERYASLSSISIDFGVMEKVDEVSVVPVDCGWSDVGSWQAAWELGEKDSDGNVVRADPERTVLHDARGNMVVAPAGKTVAILGVQDLVIVDTPDALLVVPRAQAQEVKRAVDALNQRGKSDVT